MVMNPRTLPSPHRRQRGCCVWPSPRSSRRILRAPPASRRRAAAAGRRRDRSRFRSPARPSRLRRLRRQPPDRLPTPGRWPRPRRRARRRRALPHARSARRPQARQVRRRRGRAQHEARRQHAPARGHVRSERDRPQPRLRQLRSRLRHERQAGAPGQLPRVDLLQHRGPREERAADDRVVPGRAGRCVDLGEPRVHVRRELWTARLRIGDAGGRWRRGAARRLRQQAATPPAAGAATQPAQAAPGRGSRRRTRRGSARSGPDVRRADLRHQRSAEAPPGRGRADLPRFAHAFDRHGSQRQGQHLHLRLRHVRHSLG